MPEPWRSCKVLRIENETPNTKRFWFEVPELDVFNFVPGQFITFDLPIHEQKNKCWRSYSIASWPQRNNQFELVIVLLEGGAGTHYLFNEVTVGSELVYRGPQGVFTLPDPIEKDLYLICTGTGIAPFRSMAHHLVENNVSHKEIHLIFGCRLFGDALYAAELKDMSRKIPNFYFHTCYSREEKGNADHLVRIGYVHQVYEELCQSRMMKDMEGNTVAPPASFFLCGWKNMIDEAKQRIQALGYTKKDIHQELYG
jgi:ferredoxin-NADP reductase